MKEKESFFVDLFPAIDQHGRVDCQAACKHCPNGIKNAGDVAISQKNFSYDVYEAIAQLSLYCAGRQDTNLERVSFASQIASSAQVTPFNFHGHQPRVVTYPFSLNADSPNDPSRIVTVLNDTYRILAGFFAPATPSKEAVSVPVLALSVRPSIDEGRFIEEIAWTALIAAHSLLYPRSELTEIFNRFYAGFYVSINDVSSEVFDIVAGDAEKRHTWALYQESLASIALSKVRPIQERSLWQQSGEHRLHVDQSFESTDASGDRWHYNFVVRLLRNIKPTQAHAIDPGSLGFFQDYVWVGHSTRNTVDKALHISYKDFFECIGEANKGGATLSEVLCKKLGFDPVTRQRLP